MDKCYALGIVEGVFDYHLWENEDAVEKFYRGKGKQNRRLIKLWGIENINNRSNCTNGDRLSKYWDNAQKVCEEKIKEVNEGRLSIDKLAESLPKELC